MIKKLFQIMPLVPDLLTKPEVWSSLIVNRRKPHTYRVFTKIDDLRICLHKFKPCDRHEAFLHPHPWDGGFLILDGAYRMLTGKSPDREKDPVPGPEFFMTKFSGYQITDPLDFHAIIPVGETYTIMVNGPEWPDEKKHIRAVTTKGKDLDTMPHDELVAHLQKFETFVSEWLWEGSEWE